MQSASPDAERFNGYHIQIPIFEGPLDLLLYLVKANRYDIFEIPIADITEQYLRMIRLMEMLDFELAGDFMVVAAELLVLKSKMLLPPDESDVLDEMEPMDPQRELAERLIEYQRYKEAAESLREFHDVRSQMFTRPAKGHAGNGNGNGNGNGSANGHHVHKVLLMNDVSLFDLVFAFQSVLDRFKQPEPTIIEREPMTISQRIRHALMKMRQMSYGCTFADLCEDCEMKIEVIITFLGLLELIRRRRVRAEQMELFGEIRIFSV
jgi:segregation and condensation protein A